MQNFQFCEDVLVEILCRLPDKPLIKFKGVSKAWYRLISEVCVPRISLNAPVSGLFFGTTDYSRTSYLSHEKIEYVSMEELEEEEEEKEVKVERCDPFFSSTPGPGPFFPFGNSVEYLLDTCKGLVLLLKPPKCEYYVCNPTTKQYVEIPKACDHQLCLNASLVFNPSESPDYKVVRFATLVNCEQVWLDIYASSTGHWVRHKMQLDPVVLKSDWTRNSVYLNGVLYRLSMSWHLIRLDLEGMRGHAIKLPESSMPGIGDIGCVGIWTGHLCYAKHKFRLLIFLLEEGSSEETSQWILKYSVDSSDIGKKLSPFIVNEPGWIMPNGFHPDSDLIFICTPHIISSYNLKSNKLKKLFKKRNGLLCGFPVQTHVRCLVSLNYLGKRNCTTQLGTISEGLQVLQLEMSSNDSEQSEVQITGAN